MIIKSQTLGDTADLEIEGDIQGIVNKLPDSAYWTKTTEWISHKFIFSERIIQGHQTANEFLKIAWAGYDTTALNVIIYNGSRNSLV